MAQAPRMPCPSPSPAPDCGAPHWNVVVRAPRAADEYCGCSLTCSDAPWRTRETRGGSRFCVTHAEVAADHTLFHPRCRTGQRLVKGTRGSPDRCAHWRYADCLPGEVDLQSPNAGVVDCQWLEPSCLRIGASPWGCPAGQFLEWDKNARTWFCSWANGTPCKGEIICVPGQGAVCFGHASHGFVDGKMPSPLPLRPAAAPPREGATFSPTEPSLEVDGGANWGLIVAAAAAATALAVLVTRK